MVSLTCGAFFWLEKNDKNDIIKPESKLIYACGYGFKRLKSEIYRMWNNAGQRFALASSVNSKNEGYLVSNIGELLCSKQDTIRREFNGWWHWWYWTQQWVNPNGNANFPYVNLNGKPNFNWTDNDLNENWLWLVPAPAPGYYIHSPHLAGFPFSILIICFCQPPNILPISASWEENVIYLLLSMALLSQATWRKNLSISNLIDAFCICGSFCPLINILAMKMASITSKNKKYHRGYKNQTSATFRQLFGTRYWKRYLPWEKNKIYERKKVAGRKNNQPWTKADWLDRTDEKMDKRGSKPA